MLIYIYVYISVYGLCCNRIVCFVFVVIFETVSGLRRKPFVCHLCVGKRRGATVFCGAHVVFDRLCRWPGQHLAFALSRLHLPRCCLSHPVLCGTLCAWTSTFRVGTIIRMRLTARTPPPLDYEDRPSLRLLSLRRMQYGVCDFE